MWGRMMEGMKGKSIRTRERGKGNGEGVVGFALQQRVCPHICSLVLLPTLIGFASHPSYIPSYARHHPYHVPPPTISQLSIKTSGSPAKSALHDISITAGSGRTPSTATTPRLAGAEGGGEPWQEIERRFLIEHSVTLARPVLHQVEVKGGGSRTWKVCISRFVFSCLYLAHLSLIHVFDVKYVRRPRSPLVYPIHSRTLACTTYF